MKNKKKKWIKKRNAFIHNGAKFLLGWYIKRKYHAKIEKCKDKRQRIILYNHQTTFDQFFIALGYKKSMYFLASEDLFSNGFVSKLLRFAVNPIPIKKQATDIRAVMNCVQVAKEGGSIAIAPEGNRTYSGTTEYMSPAIVKLIKTIRLPLTFFIIEGGYGVKPRWSDVVRKGKMRAYTSKTIEPEDYMNLSDDELYELIKKELYVSEANDEKEFLTKTPAEYLERAIYVCPYCGISEFISEKDTIKCLSCGKEIKYGFNKRLEGKGFDFPFSFVKEWYDYQVDFVSKLDVTAYYDKPLYKDRADLFEVALYKKKKLVKEDIDVISYGNKFVFGKDQLPFEQVKAVSVLGKNKLNVYFKEKVYQLKGSKRFNALKYVNIYYRWENFVKEKKDVKFLGL